MEVTSSFLFDLIVCLIVAVCLLGVLLDRHITDIERKLEKAFEAAQTTKQKSLEAELVFVKTGNNFNSEARGLIRKKRI